MNRPKYLVLIWIPTVLILLTFAQAQSQTSAVPQRADIQEVYKWRLQDTYATDQVWEQAFTKMEKMLPQFEKFKGKLKLSGKNLEAGLFLRDSLLNILDRLYVYANMRRDEDNRVPAYQEMSDRAGNLRTRVDQTFSFIEPEITSLSSATLQKFVKSRTG